MLFTQAGQSDGEIILIRHVCNISDARVQKMEKNDFSTLLRYTEIVSKNYLR